MPIDPNVPRYVRIPHVRVNPDFQNMQRQAEQENKALHDVPAETLADAEKRLAKIPNLAKQMDAGTTTADVQTRADATAALIAELAKAVSALSARVEKLTPQRRAPKRKPGKR